MQNQIPNNWQKVKIGDLCKIVNGKTPSRSNDAYWNGGDINWFTIDDMRLQGRFISRTIQHITDAALKETGIRLVPKDSVLVCCTASVGEVAYTRTELTTNQQFNSLIPKDKSALLSQYLYYAVNFISPELKRQMGTTTFGFVSTSKLGNLIIKLPQINVQHKIAEILSSIDEAIQKTDQVIQKTELLKQGLMRELLSKGIGHSDFRTTSHGRIPKNWKISSLGDSCNFTTGKLNSNQATIGGEYPFFTCAQETFAIDRYSFDCEAVLLAGNNASGIYSVKYYKGKFDAYQRTYVITIKDTSLLNYFFLKEILNIRLNMLKDFSVGTNTKFLTLKLLLGIKVLLPPIKEQIHISKILTGLESKVSTEVQKRNILLNLKTGLMQDIFSQKVQIN